MTDSVIGSDDVLWIRFVLPDADEGPSPGIMIYFSDPPKYVIGYCQNEVEFDFPQPDLSKYKVWTFKKQDNLLQLLYNDIKLYELELDGDSGSKVCKDTWSNNFAYVQFMDKPDGPFKATDTTSDYIRKYAPGKFIT